MEPRIFSFGARSVTVFLPESETKNVVWSVMHGDEGKKVFDLLSEPKPVLCCVLADWNRDLSPWKANAVFGTEDFSGGADDFLAELTQKMIPAVEKEINITGCKRLLVGYSLAGLFSIYAFYKTDVFSAGASLSGSLWFDGFTDFMKGNPLCRKPETFCFSLGDREKKARNPRMQKVETATAEAAELFCSLGIPTEFTLLPGGHFDNVEKRIAGGIMELIKREPR